MDHFSQQTKEKLKFYVYRLIDPRNGQTFYVGKGSGDRVFQHARGALTAFEKGEDAISTKLKTIHEIMNAKLSVVYLIHRHGMTNKESLEVESALIDCFPGLTNLQAGYAHDRGIANAEQLERMYTAAEYEEPKTIRYMIIKTTQEQVETVGSVYEATRKSWRVNLQRAKKYKYVLSVIDGIVEEVFAVERWEGDPANAPHCFFTGEQADADVRDLFLNKRIPKRYRKRGAAFPVLYSKGALTDKQEEAK